MRPESGQAACQWGIRVQMAGLCGIVQDAAVVPRKLLWAETFHGTSSSGPLLWSPAHSKLCHSWVIRLALILQDLATLSYSAETQFCSVHSDVFQEQSPLTPIPFFNVHPSKHTCQNSGVSMAPAFPDKWNRMIYSQTISFEKIPADDILIYRASPFPSMHAPGSLATCVSTGDCYFVLFGLFLQKLHRFGVT